MSVQTTPSTKITGIDLVGTAVRNLDRALAYYRDALGLVLANHNDDGAEFHFPDGSTYGLYQPPAGSPVEPGFAVFFHDEGEILNALKTPVCIMSSGQDPEGNRIILHRKHAADPHTPPQQRQTATTIKGIDLAGYLVEDVEKELAYYRALGIAPTEIDPEGRGAEFELADGQTFGIWRTPEAQRAGFVMFAVDDANAKVAELKAKGVPMSDPLETPGCIMAFGPDPEGTMVIIHQRKGHG